MKTGYLYGLLDMEEALLKRLLTSRDIVALLTGQKDHPLPALDLRYTRVFPYEYVPQTSTQAGSYITFDTDVDSVPTSTAKVVNLYVYAFCHQDVMNVDAAAAKLMGIDETGPRKKLLAAKVDEALNGEVNEDWMGKLRLIETKLFTPAQGYAGECLIYQAHDFNRVGERLYG